MKKKILFTGGSALLAINWALSIRDRYETVNGLHNRDIQLPNAATAMIDMESEHSFSRHIDEIKPDVVIHCASVTSVEACENNPSLAEHVNIDLAANVAAACKNAGVQMVYISTDHLYNGKDAMVSEDMPVSPLNVYGKTKADAEEHILSVNDAFLVVRTNFYGWGSSYRHSFSDHIITSLRNRKQANLFTDVFYTPILIDTLAHAAMDLIEKKAKGIFNLSGRERISKYAFGMRLARQFALDESLINPIHFADRNDLVQRPLDMSLSNKKAESFIEREFGNIDDDIRKLYQQEQSGFSHQIQNI